MKLVGIALLGALLLPCAGCALQTGDPTAEETQRPNELATAPGGESQTVRPVSANLVEGTQQPVTPGTAGPRATRGDAPTTPAGAGGVAPGGQKDNPNPSPWGDGIGGIGPKPAGDNGN
jgi:hypothetical protein